MCTNESCQVKPRSAAEQIRLIIVIACSEGIQRLV